MPTRRALLTTALALVLAGIAALPAAAGASTRWLCRPGLAHDPCTTGLTTTRFAPGGAELGVDRVRRARRRLVDCFYVYPTVSDQQTTTATKRIDPELRSIALFQAARFARDCRVFAPLYRQITLTGWATAGPDDVERAYGDVLAAWRTYLRRYNHGRGVVLIGHSQGTFWLKRLVTEQIDSRPRMRRKLVSALLIGGNVTVRAGADSGGDFRHVPACRSALQLGCVVAYSTFAGPVPADAGFGRTALPGREVLCTNPAALRPGGGRLLDPIVPRAPFAPGTSIGLATTAFGFPLPDAETPWLAFPGSYSARCDSSGGANVLQIAPAGGTPALRTPAPAIGLHLTDVNIALGDLTRLVRRQAAAYALRATG